MKERIFFDVNNMPIISPRQLIKTALLILESTVRYFIIKNNDLISSLFI